MAQAIGDGGGDEVSTSCTRPVTVMTNPTHPVEEFPGDTSVNCVDVGSTLLNKS